MGYSRLATYINPSPNTLGPRGCSATSILAVPVISRPRTAKDGADYFANSSDFSTHYYIGYDGSIAGCVPEEDIPNANQPEEYHADDAILIGVCSDRNNKMTRAAYNAFITLSAEIGLRQTLCAIGQSLDTHAVDVAVHNSSIITKAMCEYSVLYACPDDNDTRAMELVGYYKDGIISKECLEEAEAKGSISHDLAQFIKDYNEHVG